MQRVLSKHSIFVRLWAKGQGISQESLLDSESDLKRDGVCVWEWVGDQE